MNKIPAWAWVAGAIGLLWWMSRSSSAAMTAAAIWKPGESVRVQKDFPLGDSTYLQAGTDATVISGDAVNTTIYANGRQYTVPNWVLS